MYAGVYDDAKKRGDAALEEELREKLSFLQRRGVRLLGAAFEADGRPTNRSRFCYCTPISWSRPDRGLARGHAQKRLPFVTLEDALGDQAYGLPDTYVGEEGAGWLDHWAITQGKPPQGAPVFPQWVIDKAKPLRHPQP